MARDNSGDVVYREKDDAGELQDEKHHMGRGLAVIHGETPHRTRVWSVVERGHRLCYESYRRD